METWIYVVLVRNFFTERNTEYAAAISAENISLWADYDVASNIITQAQNQLHEAGYFIANSGNEDETLSTLYWCRMEHANGRAAVLSIHRKVVSGDLFQIERG